MATYQFLILAQQATAGVGDGSAESSPGSSLTFFIAVLAALAVLPFLFTMITSFAKLVIVGGIIRQALGTPQIPPNTVITGLALILTLHIMWPVGQQAAINYQQLSATRGADADTTELILDAAEPALRGFLERHASPANVQFFEGLQARLRSANAAGQPADADDGATAASAEAVDPTGVTEMIGAERVRQLIYDLSILAPAFMLTELTEAFQIGFLIFVPFLVIDLVVSNILLAIGMHMLSPTTVSLPFKLLLFVLVDGWRLIIQGVVLGYT
ncbi:MAG: EscR/YscR/HrcR family type III secretion system export apparatus protein [Planctomycetota bacterium]